MTMLDVSAALTNPYTLDTFIVHRRRQYVNGFGETAIDEKLFQGVRGVVHPESLNDLSRRPEAQTNTKSIVVYTRFAIRGESQSSADNSEYQPDLVEWNGNLFLVIRVEDWSNYARGFVKVTASSIDIVDQATTAKPLVPINQKVIK